MEETVSTPDLQTKFAIKIDGLLRKAETTTPEEAELLLEKAQELMAKYAIEQTMLERLRGHVSERIVERSIGYSGNYRQALYEIGSAIAHANGCRVLISRNSWTNTTWLYAIGFESDVERVVMLDSSVQIQAQVALAAAIRSGEIQYAPWMTGNRRFLERRTFLFGFASGLRRRLRQATETGRAAYVQERVEEHGEAEERVAEGMGLVLRSRKDRIDDWVDETYGEIGTGRSVSIRQGSSGAHQAGRTAGMRADTGTPRVGQRRQLKR